MLKQPSRKYRPFPPIHLPDRTWPSRVIERAPVWMSTDLRDGNQALFEPMSIERKLKMFRMLVAVGFKEIEVGFPSASQIDFDFVRMLIEQRLVPADVTIEVLTQARGHLIERTMEALQGARRAIVHLYNATAPVFRRTVFNLDSAGVKAIAVESASLIQRLAAQQPATEWVFQYSPEVFCATELPFALEVCDAVTAVWQPTPGHKAIINLPNTVEMATPNVYADQIEWMHRHLARRDAIVLSVHPHNDRGTAVAAAELAVMAGADRVEGCVFGNGERTGNVDLVTLALNLYTQGIDPGLDFSRIDEVARTVEECTQLPIHPRHPYVGDLVYTAFSGSHQDAIKKGFAARRDDEPWEVPYLPIDPADLGRSYASVIRVNSQSGKGGIAYLLEQAYGVALPRRLQVELSGTVQRLADDSGQEVSVEAIWRCFEQEYLMPAGAIRYRSHHLFEQGGRQGIELTVQMDGVERRLSGIGNGPIDAAINALAAPVVLLGYEEHALGRGAGADAVSFVELAPVAGGAATFGVGIDRNIVTASIHAIIAGLNRLAVGIGEREASA